jgi:hypothetical protein
MGHPHRASVYLGRMDTHTALVLAVSLGWGCLVAGSAVIAVHARRMLRWSIFGVLAPLVLTFPIVQLALAFARGLEGPPRPGWWHLLAVYAGAVGVLALLDLIALVRGLGHGSKTLPNGGDV